MEGDNVRVEGDAMTMEEDIDLVVWGHWGMVQALWDHPDRDLAGEDPAHSHCGPRLRVEGENLGQDSSLHADGHLLEEEEDTRSDVPLLPSSCSFIIRVLLD